MRTLKIERMGDEVQGVTLRGDKRNPEPTYFRVCLPFGDVDIARVEGADGKPEYWVHLRVNRPSDGHHTDERPLGRVVDARIDAHGKHGGTVDADVLNDPDLYHLAVRLAGG